MAPTLRPLTQRNAWKALDAHCQTARQLHLRRLFRDDPKRGERMTAEAAGLFLERVFYPGDAEERPLTPVLTL